MTREVFPMARARQRTARRVLATFGVLVAWTWLVGDSAPAVALPPDPPQQRSPHAAQRLTTIPPLRPIDDVQARADGIRKLTGKHLTLYTDLAPDKQIDELPRVFDLAVPQWCAYFGIDPADQADWHMRGCLIKDDKHRAAFIAARLLPTKLPAFHNGYSVGRELWLFDQPTAYYRRHLLLHEGTHGFTNTVLGGAGPAWYMEGIAELFATHAYHNGRLTLGYFPARREEVPMLGRIKLVQTATAKSGVKPLRAILKYKNRAFLENEPYAWCWALVKFLDTHPRYQARFRSLHQHVNEPAFTERFTKQFAGDWPELVEEWQLFAGTLQYGHDIARTAIDFKPGVPLSAGEAHIAVVADRGWQNSSLRLAAGTTYRFVAEGRYQIANKPKIWWSEPGGVTIRYHDGRPLGMLLGALWPDGRRPTDDELPVRTPDETPSETPFLKPFEIGTGTTLTPGASGTLYLKINDSPGELGDNAGRLQVRVSAS